MKNKKQKTARFIVNEKYSRSWYVTRSLADLARKINELPDAAAAINEKRRSVPRQMLPMVF